MLCALSGPNGPNGPNWLFALSGPNGPNWDLIGFQSFDNVDPWSTAGVFAKKSIGGPNGPNWDLIGT